MDTGQAVDETSREELRKKIHQTRNALGEKVEDLEGRVQRVSGSLKDMVARARQRFDLRYQVSQHPLLWLGVGLAGGLVVAGIFARRASLRRGEQPVAKTSLGSLQRGERGEYSAGESGRFIQGLVRRALSDAVPMVVQAGGAYLLGLGERKGGLSRRSGS